jgi:hypothetical protein
MDINGDSKVDMVVFQEKQGGLWNVPGLPGTPYWKVYLGTPTGFSSSATNWSLPSGGYISSGNNISYYTISNSSSQGPDNGSQLWTVMDMNGDSKVDLVVFQEKQSGLWNVPGLPGTPYWKVYLGTSTGFSSAATNWSLPSGGYISSGNNISYYDITNFSSQGPDNGSQLWTVMDMNGDSKVDMVVFQEKQSGLWNVPGLPGTPYWKIYLGTSTGFSSAATNWSLPSGGYISSGNNLSYYTISNSSSQGPDNGSQLWTVMDMNGDNKVDMVAFQEKQSTWNVPGLPGTPYWKVYLNTSSVGLKNETNVTSQVKLFPNPFDSDITLETNGEKQDIQVFNVLGTLVHSLDSESATTTIDLSDQPKGIYFVKIGSVTKKIIKE